MTDLEVNYRAEKIWNQISEKNLTAADVYHIQQSFGYDIACGILYKTFKEQPAFVDFAKGAENSQSAKGSFYNKANRDVLAAVFVHNPWESRKTNENYQWRLKNVAADMGFDCAYPEISYRRSVFPNAYTYQETMKRWAGRDVILITQGLASLEMRLVLEKSIQINANIIGWLNVSGMTYGTSLPASDRDAFYKIKKYFNDDYAVLPEVARSNGFCYGPLKINPQIEMVNMVGIRPQRYFHFFEKKREQELHYWGPHDGYVTIADYLQKPGVTWPFWGQSHYLSTDVYKRRFQYALHWLVSKYRHKDKVSL